MKKNSVVSVISFLILSCSNLSANNEVSVSKGKYANYYFIKYTLKNNFLIKNDSKPIINGQFEILLDKKNFPTPANNCQDKLILRMPATLSDSINKTESIKVKKTLFNEIKDVYAGKKNSIDIIIELNPYVSVLSTKPLRLELKNCNIFFRTKKNMYIYYLK